MMNLRELFTKLAEKKILVARATLEQANKARARNRELARLAHEYEGKIRELHEEYLNKTIPYRNEHEKLWDEICREHGLNVDDDLSMNTLDGKIYKVLKPGDSGYELAQDSGDEVNEVDSRKLN